MDEPLKLVPREPNKELAGRLRELADEAERGNFTRIIMVKLRDNAQFAVEAIGPGSDLATAGALMFALHDLINSNEPK